MGRLGDKFQIKQSSDFIVTGNDQKAREPWIMQGMRECMDSARKSGGLGSVMN